MPRFRTVTDDRFFLSIGGNDPLFNDAKVRDLLGGLGATHVEECWDQQSRAIPPAFAMIGLILFAFALIPPALVLRSRYTTSDVERIHPVQDMDFQAKYKPQQRNTFFSDGRAMRPQVPGTMSRGEYRDDGLAVFLGVNSEAPPAVAGGEGTPAPPPPAHGMNENQDWVATIPIEVSDELMARGQQRFGIYCAPCHGIGGYGNGLVNERANGLQQPTWIQVPSLHTVTTRNRADGYIFRAITEGVRKMPAYGSQIHPEDRWAIVLYVRALQQSQNAGSNP